MQIESTTLLKPPIGAVLTWFGFWLALGAVAVWGVRDWRRKRKLAGERANENVGKL